jgi:hypothetical protein
VLTHNSAGVDLSEPGDAFGEYLRVLTSRGASAWLAVGAPGEGIGGIGRDGSVTVVPGAPTGLAPAWSRQWHQDAPGLKGGAEPADSSGRM